MTELVRQWLTGVLCAALITAIADGLMPNGAVRQVGKLMCALMLLCALLRPVLKFDPAQTSIPRVYVQTEQGQRQEELEQHSDTVLKTLIERQSAAYIVDKAARLGIACQVRVECRSGVDGVWLPWSVSVTGRMDSVQRAELTAAIQTDFGIASEHQIYTGGE